MFLLQKIDVGLTGLTVTHERATVVDFTYPFWSDMQAFGVLYEESLIPLLFRPLSRDVWITYFATAVFISIVLWGSDVLVLKGVAQSNVTVDKTIASKYHDVFMYVVGAVFSQGKVSIPLYSLSFSTKDRHHYMLIGRLYWWVRLHWIRLVARSIMDLVFQSIES